ncbi:MAG TPA: hypothetical protein VFG50_03430, partial [Rhodothermales bacterium]|nr:hypothetical protein [Rhodothermales bacterium]
MAKKAQPARRKKGGRNTWLRGLLLVPLMVLATFYGVCALLLLAYNVILPPVTTVQLQRGIEALADGEAPQFSYRPVAMSRIS